LSELRHEDDVAGRGQGLELQALSVTAHLEADSDVLAGGVDVVPHEAERLADSQAGEQPGGDRESIGGAGLVK
jgi:hypothetical protein